MDRTQRGVLCVSYSTSHTSKVHPCHGVRTSFSFRTKEYSSVWIDYISMFTAHRLQGPGAVSIFW